MKQTSVALLFCILLTGLAVAQGTQQKSTAQAPSVPDTPAGRQLSAFLQALNTGDINIIRDFVISRSAKSAFAQATIDEYAQFYAAIYNDTRGLNLYSIERSGADDIVAVAQSRLAGEWHNIWLQVSAELPYGVTSIGFLSVTRPAAANPRVKMSDSEIAEQLQTFLALYRTKNDDELWP